MTKAYLYAALLLVIGLAGGCGKGNSNGGAPILNASGKHATNWVAAHPQKYLQSLTATGKPSATMCAECHGSDQKGGISGVSCFSASWNGITCHPNGPSNHPANWGTPAQHGRLGAMAAPGATSGFAYCTACHGSDFTNGTAPSCLSCHGKAPHPDAPWRGTTVSHIFTNPGNASVCFQCHAGGNNLVSISPPPAQPPGTPPGCFNGTLCHQGHNMPFSGSAHWSVPLFGAATFITECGPCHNYAATSGPFPAVPPGTAPNCRSCHIANFGNGCADCHGDATFGRPNGASFPNRQGQHRNGTDAHSNIACLTCHSYDETDSRHGWSNGVASTNASASIRASLHWVPGTRAVNQGSCNPAAGGMSGCHGSNSPWF